MLHLPTTLSAYKRPLLLFSGGKDSLALLLLFQPHWESITVAWVNTGAVSEEVSTYVRGVASKLPHFVEITGKQPEWISTYGWPADVLPVRLYPSEGIKFQPYITCCNNNLWQPVQRFVADEGFSLVITGQKKADTLRNLTRDAELQTVSPGVDYWHPLNDWTDEEVFAYLDSKRELLPPGYAEGAVSSEDCWNCTAYLSHNLPRIKLLRKHSPEKYAQIASVLTELYQQLHAETLPLFDLLKGDA